MMVYAVKKVSLRRNDGAGSMERHAKQVKKCQKTCVSISISPISETPVFCQFSLIIGGYSTTSLLFCLMTLKRHMLLSSPMASLTEPLRGVAKLRRRSFRLSAL